MELKYSKDNKAVKQLKERLDMKKQVSNCENNKRKVIEAINKKSSKVTKHVVVKALKSPKQSCHAVDAPFSKSEIGFHEIMGKTTLFCRLGIGL